MQLIEEFGVRRAMHYLPFPLNPLPRSHGDGEKLVAGFARTEQGAALHPKQRSAMMQHNFGVQGGECGRRQWRMKAVAVGLAQRS